MLTRLIIQDYAIISHLDVSFDTGFSVITGETGTGKSIILGAIAMLLGAKADTKTIRQGARQCKIEAHFNLTGNAFEAFFDEADIDFDGKQCIVTRIITSQGKSRAFINDTPCAVTVLRTLGEQLLDIHSQHKNLLLHTTDFQLSVLDTLAHNQQLLGTYEQTYSSYRTAVVELQELREQQAQMQLETDFVSYQLEQLQASNLQVGEAEELEDELQRLEHAQDLMMQYAAAVDTLDGESHGVVGALRSLTRLLEQASAHDGRCRTLYERANEAYIDMHDLASELSAIATTLTYDPQRKHSIEARLDTINTLLSKHHARDVKELLDITAKLQAQATSIDDVASRINELEQQAATLQSEVTELSGRLTATRKAVCQSVTEGIQRTLATLGMGNLRVHINITPKEEPTANGADNVQFSVDAGEGTQQRPLSTLSGGEASRVMLALKNMLTGAVQLPTIIFDEIDTGVSGRIAESMASIMLSMSRDHRQVIAITHLPQIAAMGEAHYRVVKTVEPCLPTGRPTIDSHIERLTDDERVSEIAAMLSGDNITQAAIANARALLHLTEIKN